jgi:hypothetical protein
LLSASVRHVLVDPLQDAIGQRNRPDLASLRKPEGRAVAAKDVHPTLDLDLAGAEVDVGQRKPEDLALARAKPAPRSMTNW